MGTPKPAIADKRAPLEFFNRQLGGESPLGLATAERLFAAATELIAMKPWEFLEDQNLVLLKSPLSNETCHCSIMGALGEVFSLHAYVGGESYRYFRKMAAGEPISIGEFYGSLRGVYVEFVGLSELTPPDRELARTFGHPLKRGLKAPIFRALRPGYHPWYPTENEGIVLAECIGGVLAFCERLRKSEVHDYWKEDGVYPFMVPVQVEPERKQFDIEMVRIPEPVAATPQPTNLDEDRIRKILERNYRHQGAFEVDHFYAAGMVGKRDERKACIRIGLAADVSSGFVFPPELAMPERATADIIVTVVLNAIDTARCLPREVRVNQPHFRMFLEPLASELGLAVRTVKRLPALQQAKEELLAMMGDPGPFGS
jgi:hypothetical protein